MASSRQTTTFGLVLVADPGQVAVALTPHRLPRPDFDRGVEGAPGQVLGLGAGGEHPQGGLALGGADRIGGGTCPAFAVVTVRQRPLIKGRFQPGQAVQDEGPGRRWVPAGDGQHQDRYRG